MTAVGWEACPPCPKTEALKTLCRNHRERHRIATAPKWGKGHRVAEMMSLW